VKEPKVPENGPVLVNCSRLLSWCGLLVSDNGIHGYDHDVKGYLNSDNFDVLHIDVILCYGG
jgi:hypothetical protein